MTPRYTISGRITRALTLRWDYASRHYLLYVFLQCRSALFVQQQGPKVEPFLSLLDSLYTIYWPHEHLLRWSHIHVVECSSRLFHFLFGWHALTLGSSIFLYVCSSWITGRRQHIANVLLPYFYWLQTLLADPYLLLVGMLLDLIAPCKSTNYGGFQGAHLTVQLSDLFLQCQTRKATTEFQRQTRFVHLKSFWSSRAADYLSRKAVPF